MDEMNQPSSPAAAPQPLQQAPTKKNSKTWIWVLVGGGLLFILMFFGSIFYLFSKVTAKDWAFDSQTSVSRTSSEWVAVIELKGVIMDSKKILKALRKVEKDKRVAAVVLRLDSPGGAVAPSQEIYEAVKKFPKPLVVSMGSVAASGAFYVAMGAKTVYANPGTLTGSIGVIMEFANLEKLYDWAKISRYSIKSGKFKDIGSDNRPMTPEEKAMLQDMILEVLGQFRKAIMDGRKLSATQLDAFADGRIMNGSTALKLKLVDQLGTLQDAIKDAATQAQITTDPTVVYPQNRRPNFFDLMDLRHEDEDDMDSTSKPGWFDSAVSAVTGRPLPSKALQALDERAAAGLTPGMYLMWNGAF